jgi:hypothetical protein
VKKINQPTDISAAISSVGAPASYSVSDQDLTTILTSGKWSATAEDNSNHYGEQVPSNVVQQWVVNYDPGKPESIASIGVLTLITAIAGWGVTSEISLPPDPKSKGKWLGPSHGDDGKHLMSYAVGGVGIDHTDSGNLVDFFKYLKTNHSFLAEKSDRFFQLQGINFDRIRANGGICTTPRSEIALDLDGKPFGHDKYGGGESYCKSYKVGDTTPEDWQIFRHWVRSALREKDVQRYIIDHWLKKLWLPSYAAVLKSGGTVEEAMINARIRNSSPVTADCAIDKAIGKKDRTTAQLEAYIDPSCKGKVSHKRRFGEMMRPVALFTHFRNQI